MKKYIYLLSILFLSHVNMAFAAEEWGIDGEEKARLTVKVVDIACELSGNCPAKCGEGKRQLGLLKDDGTILFVVKNFDIFAGATTDLINFCQKEVVADGLLIKSDKMPLFALQFIRLAPEGEWDRADHFIKQWAKAHPGKDSEEWFRHDPMVKEEIKAHGIYGIPGLLPPAQ